MAGTNGADCCCCGRTVVELFVASDLVPEGMWLDQDIEEVGDDWGYVGIVFPGTEIRKEGDGVSGTA